MRYTRYSFPSVQQSSLSFSPLFLFLSLFPLPFYIRHHICFVRRSYFSPSSLSLLFLLFLFILAYSLLPTTAPSSRSLSSILAILSLWLTCRYFPALLPFCCSLAYSLISSLSPSPFHLLKNLSVSLFHLPFIRYLALMLSSTFFAPLSSFYLPFRLLVYTLMTSVLHISSSPLSLSSLSPSLFCPMLYVSPPRAYAAFLFTCSP